MPRKRRNYEELEDIELPAEVAERVEAATALADRQLEEARVNFRWGVAQVEVIKRAAQLAGVPYQTWLKQVAWRQAVADLRDAAAVGLPVDEALSRFGCGDAVADDYPIPSGNPRAFRRAK